MGNENQDVSNVGARNFVCMEIERIFVRNLNVPHFASTVSEEYVVELVTMVAHMVNESPNVKNVGVPICAGIDIERNELYTSNIFCILYSIFYTLHLFCTIY